MRTALIVMLTVLLIVAAAATYVVMQPKHSAPQSATSNTKRIEPTSVPAPSTRNDTGSFHETERVWVKVPDEKTGALAWQFTSSHNDPQPDNSVLCDNPEAQFFYNNGQIITIQGTHGRVVMPGNGFSSTSAMRGPMGAPSRGELYDVIVTMSTLANPRHPVLRCRTNNVVFDNDTFRIATDAYTDKNGKVIAADQVPVQVRGDEYDFDGRGLVIRWNDLDRKLQLLEVAHGQELVVKNSSLLPSQSGATTAPTSRPTSQPTTRSARPAAAPARPAARKKGAAATQAATKPTTKKASTQPVYHAVFNGGVRITQAEKVVGLADILAVDFKGKDQDEEESASPAPADRRAAPATRRAAPATRSTVPAKPAAPTAPPLIIRWPGKLVVTPVDFDPPPLNAGEMNLHLESAEKQTRLDYSGWNVICAACTYFADGKGAQLRSSPTVPLVIVKDQAGATLFTPSLDYDQVAGRAVLIGKSHAIVPIQSSTTQPSGTTQPIAATRPSDLLKASWSESCVLSLTGKSQDEMTLQNANIVGDVHVDHPKLKLDSQTMQIGFAPGSGGDTKNVQVDEVNADGAVKTTLIDEQGAKRNVDSDHLNVAMAASPDGQWRPSVVTAEGHVYSHDDQSQLHAGQMTATLAATTQPGDTPHVQHIVAQQDVTFAANDTSGRADVLTAEAAGDDYDVHLQGQPAASVKTKDATLNGSLITIAPKRQLLGVVGAGTLTGSQQSAPGEKATPFEMTWQRALNFDGASNVAHADDHIVFTSTSQDGTKNRATGDDLTLKLADAPTTQSAGPTTAANRSTTFPTESAASAKNPTTGPTDPFGGGFGSMRSKVVELMTLAGNTRVTSLLNNDAGTLIRRMHLEASSVQVANGGQQMIVPTAGRMLFEDNRAATSQPTSAPATQPAVGLNGATAFQWQRRLTFDQKANQATIDGTVVIVHQGNGVTDSFRIEAEHVVTDMEKNDSATTQPADPGSMNKIRRLTATQAVHVATKQMQFDSEQLSFDPSTGLMIAKGDGRNPVTLYDEKGVTSGMFQELWYDTKSGQILRMLGVQGTFHR